DLDGTLLRSDASVSDFTTEVLTRGLSEGHIISFATARSYVSAKPLVGRIPWSAPIILYNGALILDPQTEQVICGQFLSLGIANQVLNLGRQFGQVPLVFGLDVEGTQRVWHENLQNEGQRQFAASRQGDPRFRISEHVHMVDGDKTMMLTYIAREEELLSLKDAIFAGFADDVHIHFTRDTYLRDYFFLEISHPRANKEVALQTWSELVGCSPRDITVFGDNLNDVGLFLGGGTRVAVANAHEELKGLADIVVGMNDEDGVGHYINSELKIGVKR
ncbi:MAG: hypothetical protein A2189_04205, partial [Paenibacillus sp. RIFOXYA1_FULL_44_5]